jgi:hypothetical protein
MDKRRTSVVSGVVNGFDGINNNQRDKESIKWCRRGNLRDNEWCMRGSWRDNVGMNGEIMVCSGVICIVAGWHRRWKGKKWKWR